MQNVNLSIEDYRNFFKRYTDFQTEWLVNDTKHASRYNLFSILKIDWKEVITHTPFLANLLNPLGSHSQGALFYRNFIKSILSSEDQNYFEDIDPKAFFIKDEFSIKSGQIDIFIRHESAINPFILIIENKLLAFDQSLQIERYYYFSKSLLRETQGKVLIVYLSPFGGEPDESSISKEVKASLFKNKEFISVSYQDHITKWIEESIELISAPVVKYTLKQYLQTIRSNFNG
jgi:hypothetical protein